MRRFLRFVAVVFCAFLLALPAARAQILTGYEPLPEPEPDLQVISQAQEPTPPAYQPLLTGYGNPGQGAGQGAPVDFEADRLDYNQDSKTIVATGHVVLRQSGRTLKADSITYAQPTDTVTATGHVTLQEINGDIHTADSLVLHDQMKNGVVDRLYSILRDGARFTAQKGERIKGEKIVMQEADYSPCPLCETDTDAAPAWQINAQTVTHDMQERRVEYDNAWFEVYGVPVAYTPYFSHPDGTVRRKSGFVSPMAGYKSNLGLFVGADYYYDITPDRDVTVGSILYSEETPILTGQYRQRWADARLELEGGVTKSERDDRIAGVTQTVDDEVRGHVLGEGLWELNEKWRAGTHIAWVSDDQYMRQYDFVNDDVLENEIYAERFAGRDYFVGRFLTFQDIRVREERIDDQPEVLPEMIASFIGEPGQVPLIGGRWNVDTSFLGLRRSGSDQDMNRFSIGGGWQRRLVSDYGLVAKAETNMRADFYNTRDSDVTESLPGRDETQTESRFFPQASTEISYPLQRPYESFQAVVEPVAGLTVAPNIDMTRNIPNEDSQDAQIDYSNLFEPNRFPGYDLVEDQSRATYGLRAGLYGYDGDYGNVFFGQSYRLQEDDNPFPRGSGLDRQSSDFVGQAAFLMGDTNFDYQFQLAGDNLSSQRHEVDFYTVINRFDLSSRYLFAKALEGTDITESREQIQASAGFYLTPEWRLRLGGTRDLGGEDSGLREAEAGLDFFGPCVFWALTGQRSLTDDASGQSDTEIIFTIGLKNLGEFRESGYPRK